MGAEAQQRGKGSCIWDGLAKRGAAELRSRRRSRPYKSGRGNDSALFFSFRVDDDGLTHNNMQKHGIRTRISDRGCAGSQSLPSVGLFSRSQGITGTSSSVMDTTVDVVKV